jgi:hypothetical protein
MIMRILPTEKLNEYVPSRLIAVVSRRRHNQSSRFGPSDNASLNYTAAG